MYFPSVVGFFFLEGGERGILLSFFFIFSSPVLSGQRLIFMVGFGKEMRKHTVILVIMTAGFDDAFFFYRTK